MLHHLLANRVQPSRTADGSNVTARATRYGEQQVQLVGGGISALADEGSYFTACTPTMGTAITLTGATQASFVATTPNVLIRNNDSAGGARIFLDFARFDFATGGTAGTRVEYAVLVDGTNRYSSGGTVLTVANANMDSANTGIALAYAGAITATAASGSVRNLYRGSLSAAIPAAGESYFLAFGDTGSGNTHVGKGATNGPVVIGPGHSALIYLWLPSQTAAPTAEVSLGWWER